MNKKQILKKRRGIKEKTFSNKEKKIIIKSHVIFNRREEFMLTHLTDSSFNTVVSVIYRAAHRRFIEMLL